LIEELFLGESEEWSNSEWLFPRAVRLLEIPAYRAQILGGLVLSLGSRTDSTQRPLANSFVSYAATLPVSSSQSSTLSLLGLAKDLFRLAQENVVTNNIVIPVLQAFDLLLDYALLAKLTGLPEGRQLVDSILELAGKSAERIKNVHRILAQMKIVVGMIAIRSSASKAISYLPTFLNHRFPKVRSDTAEFLYVVLDTRDTGFDATETEPILLETEWSANSTDFNGPAQELVMILQTLLEAGE